jgi:hypothetical protein
MNERIRELAMQADIWCDQNVAQGSPMYNNQWEYKFAELIVRECIDILPEKVEINGIYEANILVQCGKAIKEHFGVES